MIIEFFYWTVFVVAYFLITASISDYKKNEVENKLWINMLIVLSPIIIGQIYLDNTYIFDILLSLSFTSCILFLLYKFGVFGGADVKMLMALSIVFPENIFFIPIVLFVSLCSITPIGLIMIKLNKNNEKVTIPFIPTLSIVLMILLYFFKV
jgi:preflagellin peptidase FlaK